MTKVNIHMTIDLAIWEAAKATGRNLSNYCEHALAGLVDLEAPEMPTLFDVFTEEPGDIEFYNKMIHKCSEAFPGFCSRWSDMLKEVYRVDIEPYDLYKLCIELMGLAYGSRRNHE